MSSGLLLVDSGFLLVDCGLLHVISRFVLVDSWLLMNFEFPTVASGFIYTGPCRIPTSGFWILTGGVWNPTKFFRIP